MRTTEEINRRIVVERRNGITDFEDILDILHSLNEQIAALNLGQQALNDGVMGEIAGIKTRLERIETAWELSLKPPSFAL